MTHFIIETVFSLGMFINAGLFIPQALTILRAKSAGSVSIFTFAGFTLIQFTMLLHGIIHSDWILAAGSALSILTCGSVTALILYYKTKNVFGRASQIT